jgi:hypothetical protein
MCLVLTCFILDDARCREQLPAVSLRLAAWAERFTPLAGAFSLNQRWIRKNHNVV